ncbi:MAG: NAD+ synthase [Mariprofundaceae bacterium]
MKIILAQITCLVGDIAANRQRMLDMLRQAQSRQADLIVFPELAVTGYPPEDLLLRPGFLDAADDAMNSLVAATANTALVFGHPRRAGRKLYNSASVARGGELIGIYDKRRLPNYGVFDERRYFEPCDGPETFDVDGWRVGVGICEDLWSDDVARQGKSEVRDVLLNLNASPFHAGKQAEREVLMRKRSGEFGIPIAYVNGVGGQDEVVFDGGSHAVDREGMLLARAPLFDEADVLVDLAAEAAGECADMPSDNTQIYAALVHGVRDYVRRNGCADVLLGLSGGIDSALSAAIAVDALGAAHVLGVLMPSRYSSGHSVSDAEDLAANLGIETVALPIHSVVNSTNEILRQPFAEWGKTGEGVTEENIQARVRGLLLMAISNKTGRMLLTTGNKSEMAVGYATLYGDMAGGFAVLKDVYKMQVYELADYVNREHERIPKNTIAKPPSAELRPDQKDADSLPDYAVLDAILEAYIENRHGLDEIVRLGFDESEVRRIIRMLHQAEYKRRQAPPGVKITRRAFGRDRRYPITHAYKEW